MSHPNVDDFHGQSERWVSQELCVHVVLIILTRLFTNRGEAGIIPDDGKPEMQANFKNGLAVVTRNIGNLLLEQAAVLSETVTRILAPGPCPPGGPGVASRGLWLTW